METLFFILGIASVVVIATAIVAVVSIVKVTRLQARANSDSSHYNKLFNNIYRDIDDNAKDFRSGIGNLNSEVSRRVDNVEQHFTSQLDSRLDKLANKTDKSFEELHRIFNDYINNSKKLK